MITSSLEQRKRLGRGLIFRQRVACRIDHLVQLASSLISTVWCRLLACWWTVRIGKGCRFFGRIRLFSVPNSEIFVGDGCTFRSSEGSNKIGINRSCHISTLKGGARIIIGDRCGFSGTVVGAAVLIEFGNDVRCGANTTITDTDWHESDPRSGMPAPVVIEDNVWLGLNVTVLKGVRIGRNSVIAAGSVVTRDIPVNVVAGGIPARVLKSLVVDGDKSVICAAE